VPLLRDGVPLGVITIGHPVANAFTDKQFDLLRTFAEQAVIAIGDAATFQVLKAMSASPGDPQPVFDLVTRQVGLLSRAASAVIFEYDGELAHIRSAPYYDGRRGAGAAAEYFASFPRKPTPDSVSCRAILEARTIYTPDLQADPFASEMVRALGH